MKMKLKMKIMTDADGTMDAPPRNGLFTDGTAPVVKSN